MKKHSISLFLFSLFGVAACNSGPVTLGKEPGKSCGVCSGQCVEFESNPDHCGRCDTACSTDKVCSMGACADSCSSGLVACGRACADLSKDSEHCGACGNACSRTQSCSGGTCVQNSSMGGASATGGTGSGGFAVGPVGPPVAGEDVIFVTADDGKRLVGLHLSADGSLKQVADFALPSRKFRGVPAFHAKSRTLYINGVEVENYVHPVLGPRERWVNVGISGMRVGSDGAISSLDGFPFTKLQNVYSDVYLEPSGKWLYYFGSPTLVQNPDAPAPHDHKPWAIAVDQNSGALSFVADGYATTPPGSMSDISGADYGEHLVFVDGGRRINAARVDTVRTSGTVSNLFEIDGATGRPIYVVNKDQEHCGRYEVDWSVTAFNTVICARTTTDSRLDYFYKPYSLKLNDNFGIGRDPRTVAAAADYNPRFNTVRRDGSVAYFAGTYKTGPTKSYVTPFSLTSGELTSAAPDVQVGTDVAGLVLSTDEKFLLVADHGTSKVFTLDVKDPLSPAVVSEVEVIGPGKPIVARIPD